MKSSISIWFLLIATCSLVAHAVVPHHHHNKIPVALINVFDCDAMDSDLHHEHGNHCDDDGHHDGPSHHHNGGYEECFISEVQVPTSLKSQSDVVKLLNNSNKGVCQLNCITKCIGVVVWQPPAIHSFLNSHFFRHKPYLAGVHMEFVARAKGLRAPPSC